ncbi:MAG: ring-opening amidohydrolase [Acidimicrobiales bacterium]
MPLVDVSVAVCPMDSPTDVTALAGLLDKGGISAADVVAVIGKTEGTGLSRDIGREAAHHAIVEALAQRLASSEDVEDRVSIILSGGTPGVLSPHVTVISRTYREPGRGDVPGVGLTVGRARSVPIRPEEVGRVGQIKKVADAVATAQVDAGIASAADIHLVMVKGPSITRAGMLDARSRGADTVTTDLSIGPEGAMCYANDGAALGVALALGEVSADRIADDVVRRDWDLYSPVAMTSSGGEKTNADVVLLGNAPSLSRFRVGHSVLRDFLDAAGVKEALRNAGLEFECCPSDLSRIVQVFAKFVIPDSDLLRGFRILLADDAQGFATAKAVGGAVVGSVIGRPTVWVSGGERNSHQGPPGGTPVAAIVATR